MTMSQRKGFQERAWQWLLGTEKLISQKSTGHEGGKSPALDEETGPFSSQTVKEMADKIAELESENQRLKEHLKASQTGASPNKTVDLSGIPDGWIVWDMGQDPLFNLWHMTLVKSPEGKGECVGVEEMDSPADTLAACLKLIHDNSQPNAAL